jgi:hypothetical protein
MYVVFDTSTSFLRTRPDVGSRFIAGDRATLPDDLSEREQEVLAAARTFRATEAGYAALQSTKPQIAAYGLIDSPAGLAAWIVEKFSAWSDGSGDVERAFSRDDLLTKVYWGDRKNRLFAAAHRESSANPSLR